RAVRTTQPNAVDNREDLSPVFAGDRAAPALVPVDHQALIFAVPDYILVSCEGAAVWQRNLDLVRIAQRPTRTGQAVQGAVIRSAVALGGVITDIEVGNRAVRPAKVSQQIITRAQHLHRCVVDNLVRFALLPDAELLRKVF